VLDFEHVIWISFDHRSVFLWGPGLSCSTTYYIYCIFQLYFSHGTWVALII